MSTSRLAGQLGVARRRAFEGVSDERGVFLLQYTESVLMRPVRTASKVIAQVMQGGFSGLSSGLDTVMQ